MTNTLEPLSDYDYLAVGSTHRVYVIFSQQDIPLWTCLLRLGLARYQRMPVTYTHCLLAVNNTVDESMTMYEMDFYNGMNAYTVEYNELYYNHAAKQLNMVQEQFNGMRLHTEYTAIDVTSMLPLDVNHHTIDFTWYQSYTEERLTPCTLARHLLPQSVDRVTWTCSGIVHALLGRNRYASFVKPYTPDQLFQLFNQ
jgi:hypothetical protein